MSNPFGHPNDAVLEAKHLPVIAAVHKLGPNRIQYFKAVSDKGITPDTNWRLDGKQASFSQILVAAFVDRRQHYVMDGERRKYVTASGRLE